MDTPAPKVASATRLAAAGGAVLAATELATLPAAFVTSVVLVVVGRWTRWRPDWLALIAGLALARLIAAGPQTAGASLRQSAAGAAQVATAALAAAGRPERFWRVIALAAHQRRMPELAVVVLLASLQAAGILWLAARRRSWPGWRPGLVAVLHRRLVVRALRAGQTVTAAGCAVGVDAATGRTIGMTWAEAEQGVLATGPASAVLAPVALAMACAALRRRKALIVLDLAAAGQCSAAGWEGGADRGLLAGRCSAAGRRGGADRRSLDGWPGQADLAATWLAAGVLAIARGLGEPATARVLSDADDPGDVTRLLGLAVRDRGVVILTAEEPPDAGHAVAALANLLLGLRQRGLRGDTLVCLTVGEQADPAALAGLLRAGQHTGTALLLLSSSALMRRRLKAAVGRIVTAGPAGTIAIRPGGLEHGPKGGKVTQRRSGLAVPIDLAALRGPRTFLDHGLVTRTLGRVTRPRSRNFGHGHWNEAVPWHVAARR